MSETSKKLEITFLNFNYNGEFDILLYIPYDYILTIFF